MQIYETLIGNGQSMDCENFRFVCKSKTRGLAMVKVWILNIVFLLRSSFDTAYNFKTRFGLRQKLIMSSYRFTHVFVKCERA